MVSSSEKKWRRARVCESCMWKRARWFCGADDAFLCQSCDVSVHSANQLARRHDRIRLETASTQLPPWPKGLTRKPRTPRPNKQILSPIIQKASVFSLVPEIGSDDDGLLLLDDNEEEHAQFLNNHHHHQQVPVLDPLIEEENLLLEDFGDGFLPAEVDLAEFVENFLGRQQEEDQETQISGLLKVKDEEQEELAVEDQDGVEINGGVLGWNFKGEENKVVPLMEEDEEEELLKKNIFLRLNYDAVIKAWDAQSSPYTTGNRPEFDLHQCWLGWRGRGEWKKEGEREARVSRYREKRRTRLFSKKIRYQVRKLNAEKRPRMKGRFVKRSSSSNHITFP